MSRLIGLTAVLIAGLLLEVPAARADDVPEIVVRHAGQVPATGGPDTHFTGAVRVDDPFKGTPPARLSGATVTFAPGARTAWHTHPLGQTLIVTAEAGWVQRWGSAAQPLRPGDVVSIPPGVKHWHGAAAATGMTHIAIVEALDGTTVEWLEKVDDDAYAAATEQPRPAAQSGPGAVPFVPAGAVAAAPGLAAYTDGVLAGDLWKRTDLSPRDRSLVTVASLVAANQAAALPAELERALDNGVTPAELAEVITHLAFYTGWPGAVSASAVAREVFTRRGLALDQPAPAGEPLPVDPDAETKRTAYVARTLSATPALRDYTNGVLFGDLWRRPGLKPRDRSLVTISALITGNRTEQLVGHLNLGLDNGLTKAEVGAVITQLAFYAGWPSAVSAAGVAKAVFASRA